MSDPPSPPSKRLKLESPSPPTVSRNLRVYGEGSNKGEESVDNDGTENEPQCSICLQDILDRTVIPSCSHEFCFECILVWSEQSRRCPLCSQAIGQYIIHNIRSRYDFRKHYLTPLRTSPEPLQGPARLAQEERIRRRRTARVRDRDVRMREEREESDKLERSIAKRRWLYQHHLYAKHVASNSYTKYRPYPTPAQFSASNELISRTTIFLRRELRIWDDLDVEFLTSFIISIMKSIDIRSESAVKLLAEFLDMDAPYMEGGRHVNAEHFAHEVYSYVRSPFRDLFVYDTVAQYDTPAEASSLEPQQGRRWREASWSRSRSRSQSRHSRLHSTGNRDGRRSSSGSWSPSGRIYHSTIAHEGILDIPTTSECRHPRRRSKECSPNRDYLLARDDSRGRDRRTEPRHACAKQGPSSDAFGRVGPYRCPLRTNAKGEPSSEGCPAHVISDHHPDSKCAEHDLGADRNPASQRVGKIIKGKERADNGLYSRTGVAAQEARSGQMESSETTESQHSIQLTIPDSVPAVLHASHPKRPPRNRNLLDSVHAHLTLASREHSIRVQPKHATSILHDSRAPSLHRRLSDAHTDEVQPSTPASGPNHERPTSGKNAKPEKGMSAPDIMARTRARHTRCSLMPSTSVIQPHETDSSLFLSKGCENDLPSNPARKEQLNGTQGRPASDVDALRTTQDHAPEGMGQTANSRLRFSQASARQVLQQSPQLTASGLSSGALPPHHSYYHVPPSNSMDVNDAIKTLSHPPSMSPLTVRDRLLAKLEEEKSCARGTEPTVALPTMSAFDRTFPESAGRLSVNPCLLTEPNTVDTQSMEARLRTRAQLRIRLSAEKKSAGA